MTEEITSEFEDNYTTNIQNEILFIGAVYKKPDLFIEFDRYIRSKYYFSDAACRFFYNEGYALYKNRTQTFTESAVHIYMSEDPERFSEYKKYGGYKTLEAWMDASVIEDAKTYFDILQKYTLVREYERKGINTKKYVLSPKFGSMTPKQFYYNIKKTVDDVHTRITGDPDVEVLNTGVEDMVNQFLQTPSMGEITPFYSFNELFRGLRRGTAFGSGMTTNSGKTRFLVKLLAYTALIRKQKCMVILNEMGVDDIRLALLTTVLNNVEFQKVTGVYLSKKERELALGIYNDVHGEILERERDVFTNEFTEPLKEYIERLKANSPEYIKIIKVSKWIEEQMDSTIFVVDAGMGYTDADLEAYIRKAHETKGVNYFWYDTLKNQLTSIGDWAALLQTTTKLTELAKNLEVFIFFSLQLTDDTNFIDPLDLNSSNIAASKGMKQVLSSLVLWKEIEKSNAHKYEFVNTMVGDDWGKQEKQDIPIPDSPNEKLYACVIDKNRSGAKTRLLFSVNLDTNQWFEMGVVYKK